MPIMTLRARVPAGPIPARRKDLGGRGHPSDDNRLPCVVSARNRYYQLKVDTTSPSRRTIGKRWLDHFRLRHPGIQRTWAVPD